MISQLRLADNTSLLRILKRGGMWGVGCMIMYSQDKNATARRLYATIRPPSRQHCNMQRKSVHVLNWHFADSLFESCQESQTRTSGVLTRLHLSLCWNGKSDASWISVHFALEDAAECGTGKDMSTFESRFALHSWGDVVNLIVNNVGQNRASGVLSQYWMKVTWVFDLLSSRWAGAQD